MFVIVFELSLDSPYLQSSIKYPTEKGVVKTFILYNAINVKKYEISTPWYSG